MAERRRRDGQGAFWGDPVGPNPTDRAKNGTKRSVIVEADGGPLGVVVAGANVHDSQLLRQTMEAIVVDRPEATGDAPQHVCLDKGYDNPTGRTAAAGHYAPHIRRIGEEKLDEKRRKLLPRVLRPLAAVLAQAHPRVARPPAAAQAQVQPPVLQPLAQRLRAGCAPCCTDSRSPRCTRCWRSRRWPRLLCPPAGGNGACTIPC